MKSISRKYQSNANEFCVCKNNSCSKTNETETAYQNGTIYRTNKEKDVHVNYEDDRSSIELPYLKTGTCHIVYL